MPGAQLSRQAVAALIWALELGQPGSAVVPGGLCLGLLVIAWLRWRECEF